MTKRITAAAGLATALLALTACNSSGSDNAAARENCTPQHEFDTLADGELTVALPDLPPFSANAKGGPEGVDVDIVQAIAEMECLSVRWEPVSYAAAIPAVQSGRADLAVGDYYRTKERAEVVSLSDPMYLDQMGAVSKDGITSIAQMESRKVGTVEGYLWVEDMRAVLDGKISIYPSNTEMLTDLKAGRIDVGLDSYGAAVASTEGTDYVVKVVEPDERVAASVEPAQANLAHDPDNAELTTALNEDLEALRSDGRLAKILESHGLDASGAEVGEPRLIG